MSEPPVDPLEQTTAEPERPGTLVAGAPVGGYSLLAVLGEGGMGVVWSAHDPNLDRTLAIKVLKRSDAAPALRMRLLREARAMARLKHPNVLTVYEVGTEGDRDYIAMELVEGSSMEGWLGRQPARDEVVDALLAAGRGLAAAHAAGLVHRDFKPHNVLRSHDGRVLVTDFGLARGLADDMIATEPERPAIDVAAPVALDRTLRSPAGKHDSVLDSPLTQTGALIGTPAYMAPEQFSGSEPDPRTDQFAYCVTAWQALTGARPYTGATLAELRVAACAGVAGVAADLPPAVREILERGLDPDPDKRWPDMRALLDAFERATRPPRPRWVYALGAAAVIAIALPFAVLAARRAPAVAEVCDPDGAFAETWSKRVHDELAAKLDGATLASVGATFDAYLKDWRASYYEACKETRPKQRDDRLACLRGARDHAGAVTQLLRTSDRDTARTLAIHDLLPGIATCSRAAPVIPPPIPEDQPRRTRIIAAMGRALSLDTRANSDIAGELAALEREAAELDWKPLLPEIVVAGGNAYLRRGQLAQARRELTRAQTAAHAAGDAKLEAIADLGLYEASARELERPGDGPAKPNTEHQELLKWRTYTRAAIKAAGDDPTLLGALALLEAKTASQRAQWNANSQAFEDALSSVAEARKQFEAAGDPRRFAVAATIEAQIYLARGDERALDDAIFAARTAEQALAKANLPPHASIDELRAIVAGARGDFDEVHRLLAGSAPRPPDVAARTGRVVDAAGHPVEHAQVVAWTGELHGDPVALVDDVRELHGEQTVTAADGTFTIHAPAGAAVIAGLADTRSTPRPLDAPGDIRLEPTTVLAGTVDARSVYAIAATARFTAGAATWTLRAPIGKDRAYHLARVPHGAATVGVLGSAGDGSRRVTAPTAAQLRWPYGRAIEVVARGVRDPDSTVWLFRGAASPATREALDQLAARADDIATAPLHAIGADATDAGRAIYEPGDRHAVITGNREGEITACITTGAAVVCQRANIFTGSKIVTYPDGRYATDAQVVLVAVPAR